MMITQRERVEWAVSDAVMGLTGAFTGGLVVPGVLAWAVRSGVDVRWREPAPPRPDQHPNSRNPALSGRSGNMTAATMPPNGATSPPGTGVPQAGDMTPRHHTTVPGLGCN
jgi:hypothetical protein